jgi:hypothetical protein
LVRAPTQPTATSCWPEQASLPSGGKAITFLSERMHYSKLRAGPVEGRLRRRSKFYCSTASHAIEAISTIVLVNVVTINPACTLSMTPVSPVMTCKNQHGRNLVDWHQQK